MSSFRRVASTATELAVESYEVAGEAYPRTEILGDGRRKSGPGTIPTSLQAQLRMTLIGDAVTLTNLAAADAFFGSNASIWPADLAGFTQVRLTGRVTTAGAGGKIQLRHRVGAFSTTVAEYLIMGASSVQILTTTAGVADSGWINLITAAKADGIFLGLMTIDGDGVIDPVVNNIEAHFR